LVVETMTKQRPQYAPIPWIQSAVGVDDRGTDLRKGMETTLERLDDSLTPVG